MPRIPLKPLFFVILLTVTFLLYKRYKWLLFGSEKKIISSAELLSRSIPSSSFREYSYIHSVFRVTDEEIRVTFIKSYVEDKEVYYKYGNTTSTVHFECVLPTCIDTFSKPCNMVGYVGIIREKHNEETNTIEFTSKKSRTSDTYELSLNITDVRVKPGLYPHQLGVCVQPVYLHSDYVLFIHFFEYWISQGATKFYIYRESYTVEVQKIINLYNQTSNIDIELIDWSLLPKYAGVSMEDNPNAYIYRLEMILSIFDCIHRSRGNAKFVAQTDLDEFIFIKNGQRVVDFMENYSRKMPFFSSVSFQSQRILFDGNKTNQINSPLDVDFSIFNQVKLEDRLFDRPIYSKLIYRPERVFRVHTHKQYPPAMIPGTNITYQNELIDPTDGVVLHVRRSFDGFQWRNFTDSDVLSSLAPVWSESYTQRTSGYNFGENKWENIGIQVVQEVDSCRKRAYKNKNRMCHNILICEEELSKKYSEAFIHSNNSWYFV